jgi:hypothetical protein
VTAGGGVQPGCMMKILEAERWLKGTNSHRVASSNDKAEGLQVSPMGARRHGRLSKGVTLLLKSTLPTCVPSRRGLSLLQHAPRSSPYGVGAGSHASCNRRAGRYVQATAPPLAPLPRLLDCGPSTATRGDPAHDPAAPAWRDGQYGQKWTDSNGGGRRAGAAVTSSAKLTSHPGAAREPSLTA